MALVGEGLVFLEGRPRGRNSLRSCSEKSSPGDPPGTPEISDLVRAYFEHAEEKSPSRKRPCATVNS